MMGGGRGGLTSPGLLRTWSGSFLKLSVNARLARRSKKAEMSSIGRGRIRGGGISRRRSSSGDGMRHGIDSSPSLTPHPTTRLDEEDDGMTQPPSPSTRLDTMSPRSDIGSSSSTKELDPKTLWFGKTQIVHAIADSIKRHYNEPYLNWTETPAVVKDHWFAQFRKAYQWRPELDAEVRAAYDENAQKRLKYIVNKAAKRRTPPKWMSADVHSGLKAKRVDLNFKIRSERALANKKASSDSDNIDPGHRQGFISNIELAERMAQANSSIFPSAADVYVRSHSVKDKDGGRRLMGKKAKEIKDYEELGGIKSLDEIFYDVVGGRKKGKVYGLGCSADLYYQGSSSRSSQSTASYTPSIISQLEQRVSEAHQMAAESRRMAEQQRELMEAQREMYERQLAEQRAYMQKMQKQLEQFSQVIRDQCGKSRPGGARSGLAA